ncbi:MAG TPA: LysR substrate-binding domain-containing protein [Ferrovibrio sp.]|uniref:LysR substrate-binding domain-containing protein n=1 Tax=Ferrovibrio sp. TaxID=1917215 RepID=UPI002ED65258
MLPTFAMRWFMPRLADFHRRHPEITVDVTSADRPIDFQAEPIDVGIQYGTGNWPELTAEFLMGETVILVASPALLKARPVRQPDDVRRHVLLTHSTRPEAWAEWFAAAGLKAPKAARGPAFEHFFMSIEAAANGLGLALVPDIFVQAELADGRLVEPLPRCRLARKGGYYLLHLPGRGREPAIKAFRDWLLG